MVWSLHPFIPLSVLFQARRALPATSVLMPPSSDPEAALSDRYLARAQARALRDATRLQALKWQVNGL